jgi:hypothetical protein
MTAQGDEGQATELRALERVERKKRPLPNGDEEE